MAFAFVLLQWTHQVEECPVISQDGAFEDRSVQLVTLLPG